MSSVPSALSPAAPPHSEAPKTKSSSHSTAPLATAPPRLLLHSIVAIVLSAGELTRLLASLRGVEERKMEVSVEEVTEDHHKC
jgi:hypothetical protein